MKAVSQAYEGIRLHLARNVLIYQLMLWKENWLVGYLGIEPVTCSKIDWWPLLMWFEITLVECSVMRKSGPYTFFICTVVLALHLRKIMENLCQGSKTLLHRFILYIWPPCGQHQLVCWPSVAFDVSVMTSYSLFSAVVPSKLPNEGVPPIIWLGLKLLVFWWCQLIVDPPHNCKFAGYYLTGAR